MRVIYKKAKSILLLATIVLSTIAGLFTFPSTALASAIPDFYIDPQVKQDATKNGLRVAMALCLTKDDSGGGNLGPSLGLHILPAAAIVSGDWFASKDTRPNIFNSPNGDTVSCGSLVKNHSVASTFGWAGNIEMACGIGLVRIDNTDCINSPTASPFTDNNVKKKDPIYAALDRQKPNITPGIGDNGLQDYIMGVQTYITTCKATPVANLADATPDQAQSGDPHIQVVDYQGNITTVIYHQGNNNSLDFRNYENNFQILTYSCNQMRDQIINGPNGNGQHAKDYAAWVKQHQPGMNGVPGTCDEAYPGSTPQTVACQAGFTNKTDPSYCQNTYPQNIPGQTQQQFGACQYGASTATAASGATAPPAPTTSAGTGKTKCAIGGVGWILCPIINDFLAPVVDAAYGFVSSLLTVQPLIVTAGSPGAGIYDAWSIMRNFANISFVIAFLVIIFSQLSSVGITNYGIKKMLPRLILAAILVNVSFWICSIAVDLSNIAGSSMNGIFQGVANGITQPSFSATSTGSGAVGWVGLSAAILAGVGIALYIGLAALIPALIAVLLAVVTVFIVLTVRQAMIVLLIVISPLAFVAYLLPNTESLFHKWRQFFTKLLEMYVIIAFIFGGSAVASKIVMTTAPAGDYHVAIQIMGAMIAVIPLGLTPIIMKVTSGALGKVAGFVNNPNRGPFDRMKKGAAGYRGYRQNVRGANALSGTGAVVGAGHFKRVQNKNLRNTAAQNSMQSAQAQFGVSNAKAAGYTASSATSQAQINAINNANNTRFVTGVANNPGQVSAGMGAASSDPLVRNALDAQQKRAIAEAIKDAEITANIPPGELGQMGQRLEAAVKNNDSITARAMQNMLLQSGSAGIGAYRDSMNKLEGQQTVTGENTMASGAMTEMRSNLLQNHGGIKSVAADLTAQAVNGGDLSAASLDPKTWKMTDAELVGQKTSSLNFALNSGAITKVQAASIYNNPELSKHIEREVRDKIGLIANQP